MLTNACQTESSAAETNGDPLESILKQLTSGLDDSDGDNDELQTILETMMQQLMSKEILYEPLRELYDKVLSIYPIII